MKKDIFFSSYFLNKSYHFLCLIQTIQNKFVEIENLGINEQFSIISTQALSNRSTLCFIDLAR
jgi:hypothetical protein